MDDSLDDLLRLAPPPSPPPRLRVQILERLLELETEHSVRRELVNAFGGDLVEVDTGVAYSFAVGAGLAAPLAIPLAGRQATSGCPRPPKGAREPQERQEQREAEALVGVGYTFALSAMEKSP